MIKNKRKWAKNEMSRTIVIYCLRVLSITLIWAGLLKTYAVIKWGATDLSDVLIYTGGAFGIELISLAFKRIFADKKNNNEEDFV